MSLSKKPARQFDQLASLLEQAYNLPLFPSGDVVTTEKHAERSAAAIAAVIIRDLEAVTFQELAEWLGCAVPDEVRKLVIEMRSRMQHDPAVDHAVLRFKFALRMLRDYRPVVPFDNFVMPGAFGIVAETDLPVALK